jgi:O-antigen ligase
MFTVLKGIRRWVAFATLPLIMNAIILTVSRGAIIGMLASGVATLLLAPKANRKFIVIMATLGLSLLLFLSNDSFWSRMSTISVDEGTMDESAAIRILLVHANWQMFLDNPLGSGARSGELRAKKYLPKYALNAAGLRAPHNTWMAILVEWGLPGGIIFGLLHIWAAHKLIRLRKLDRLGLPPLLGMMRAAIGSGLLAFVVCGLFINVNKAEVAIWLLAFLTVLEPISLKAIADKPATV